MLFNSFLSSIRKLNYKLNSFLYLCNNAFCGRCFDKNILSVNHSSGGIYKFMYENRISVGDCFWEQFASNFIYGCDFHHRLNHQVGQPDFDYLLGDILFNSKREKCKLSLVLFKIIQNRNNLWAKHSPERNFISSDYYPNYNNDNNNHIAIEVSDLRTMRCFEHGFNLNFQGLIPLLELKNKVRFTIEGIPVGWGRDHHYFSLDKLIPKQDWIYAIQDTNKPNETWFPIKDLSEYNPVLDVHFIKSFIQLIDKIEGCLICFGN